MSPVSLDLLARTARDLLDGAVLRHDESEATFVRWLYTADPAGAYRYVEARLLTLLKRLRDPVSMELAWADGPAALCAFETWRDLAREQVTA